MGKAVSGQATTHSIHWVQFSSIKTGTSRLAVYLEAFEPEPDAVIPTDAKADAGWSYPKPALNSLSKFSILNNGALCSSPAGWVNSSVSQGEITCPMKLELSGAFTSPGFTSNMRSNPSVITFIFESTTASPKRPNFATYCARTTR